MTSELRHLRADLRAVETIVVGSEQFPDSHERRITKLEIRMASYAAIVAGFVSLAVVLIDKFVH